MLTSVVKISSLATSLLVIFVFAFLLHFVWEMWQIPFYEDMLEASHWSAVIQCTRATFGDGVIAIAAYSVSAIVVRDAAWLYCRKFRTWTLYLLIGLLATVLIEFLSTEVYDRWQYSDSMPIVPILNTGVTPLLQWAVLPPIYLWMSAVFLQGLGNSANK